MERLGAIKGKSVELYKLAQYMSMEGIDSRAVNLFMGYDTFEKFYEELEEQGASMIVRLLNTDTNADGVMVTSVYETLLENKEACIRSQQYFNVTKQAGRNMGIAITGKIREAGSYSKEEFIELLKARYSGKINFIQMDNVSMTNGVEVLVCDDIGGKPSGKVKSAGKINEKYKEIEDIREDRGICRVGEKVRVCTSNEVIEELDKYSDEINV